MPKNPKCKKINAKSGIVAITVSCNKNGVNCVSNNDSCLGEQPVCIVDHSNTIHQCVRIKNRRLYEADISCIGRILRKPKKIRFDSRLSNSEGTEWYINDTIEDHNAIVVNDIKLVSERIGPENIRTDIEIEWPYFAPPEQVDLTIIVDGFL